MVEHEIKLEESVKFIHVVLTLGVSLNAFVPVFDVREAFANATQRGTEALKSISSHLYGIQFVIDSK